MNVIVTGDERLKNGDIKPLTLTVNAVCTVTGLGPTKIWGLIREGRLDVVRVDGRTLVKYSSIERLLSPASAEKYGPRQTPKRKRGRPAKVRPGAH